ncbi:hypothetical protein REPUB_Repub02eG0207900 [Reevesia pubescens]
MQTQGVQAIDQLIEKKSLLQENTLASQVPKVDLVSLLVEQGIEPRLQENGVVDCPLYVNDRFSREVSSFHSGKHASSHKKGSSTNRFAKLEADANISKNRKESCENSLAIAYYPDEVYSLKQARVAAVECQNFLQKIKPKQRVSNGKKKKRRAKVNADAFEGSDFSTLS